MKKFDLILDTETSDLSGNVYDIGWTIADRKGNIQAKRNWLVLENFTDPDKMMGAFYAKKLFTHYAPMLQAGTIAMRPWFEIMTALLNDIEAWDIGTICAYNAGFDLRVIDSTHFDLTGEDWLGFDDCEILDIWQFACETKLRQKSYARIARELGWVSPAGNLKTGAEFAFRYVSGDHSFIEDHTALSDAVIETAILAECYRQKKKIPYGIFGGAPWRLVNQNAGYDAHIHGSTVQ